MAFIRPPLIALSRENAVESSEVLANDLTVAVVQERLRGAGNFVPEATLRPILNEAFALQVPPDFEARVAKIEEVQANRMRELQIENENLVRHLNAVQAEARQISELAATLKEQVESLSAEVTILKRINAS
jgi:predicted ATP-grasp superfamily ATP-dependent carboligase